MTIKNITKETACCNFCGKDSYELTIQCHICETCLEAFNKAIYGNMYRKLKRRNAIIGAIVDVLDEEISSPAQIIGRIVEFIKQFEADDEQN